MVPMQALKRASVVFAAAVCGLSMVDGPAQAAPAAPSPPPYIPGAPYAYPGSYLYPYNLIPVSGPATTDERGIRAADNADPSMSSTGLPGSQLGQTANKGNVLGTSSSMKYHIGAGLAPTQTVQPGITPEAGDQFAAAEDPGGAPPKNASGSEAAGPTSLPAVPGNAQILEDVHGQSGGPQAESTTPSSAPSAPTVQVWPQTPGFAPGAFGTGTGPGISAGLGQ